MSAHFLRFTQCAVILGAGILLTGNSCFGSGGYVATAVPYGTDTRRCEVWPTQGWNAHWPELDYSFDTTRHCPYTVVEAGSPLPFRLTFRVSPYGYTQLYVWSAFGIYSNTGSLLKNGGNYPFVPTDPSGWQESIVESTYPGGIGNYPYRDSAAVVVYGGASVPLYPGLSVIMPGRIEQATPAISGANYVVANYPQHWSANVSEEPLSYRYQWSVNGSDVPGATGNLFSHTLTPGNHVVGLFIRRSDGSKLFVQRGVEAIDCGGPDWC